MPLRPFTWGVVAKTTPGELREKLADNNEPTVVDIRDPSSCMLGHIPRSENLPAVTLGPKVFDRKWPAEVIVSCYANESSKQVASVLDGSVDADMSNLRSGFDVWDGTVRDDTESKGKTNLGPASPF